VGRVSFLHQLLKSKFAAGILRWWCVGEGGAGAGLQAAPVLPEGPRTELGPTGGKNLCDLLLSKGDTFCREGNVQT